MLVAQSFIMLLRGEALLPAKLSLPMKLSQQQQQQQQQQLPGASITVGAPGANVKNEASKLLDRIQRLSENNTFVLKTVENTSTSSRNVLGTQIRSGSLKVVSEAHVAAAAAVAALDATLPDQQQSALTIGPESILLQKVSSTNRYEAYVSISLGSPAARAGAVEVRLQSSVAFLRLSRSQVTMSMGCSKER